MVTIQNVQIHFYGKKNPPTMTKTTLSSLKMPRIFRRLKMFYMYLYIRTIVALIVNGNISKPFLS